MRKSYTILWSALLFLAIFNNVVAQDNAHQRADMTINYSVGQGMICIENKDFEKFLDAVVIAALQSNERGLVSEAIFRCYEQITSEGKFVSFKDLEDAIPELFLIIDSYCKEHAIDLKAPRPSQNNGFVGPGTCDLGTVLELLHAILAKLHACCNTVNIDVSQTLSALNVGFNGTFSALNTIEHELQGTFSFIADINNTLTTCCSDITLNFNSTFSILAAGFGGTFTMLNTISVSESVTAILDIQATLTACCATVQRDFQETWTILEEFNPTTTIILTFLSQFQQTWSILGAGFDGTFSALDACCNNITSEFQQTWSIIDAGFDGTFTALSVIQVDNAGTFSVIAAIQNIIVTDFNGTWSILGTGFDGTFSSLPALVNSATECIGTVTVLQAGFNGTFSALNACCNNITSEFHQTWSILDAGFDSTFSLLASIQSQLSTTVVVDLRGVYTALAAGFNGTFSSIADIKNVMITDFNGTFSVLDALFRCFSTSVTAGGNITTPGYYCFANDINGSFTITANNVVLDLNSHTLSNGGIFVLTGTNRTVKNGRLDNSNTGIVLTANSNTAVNDLTITNATLTPAITFTGVHFDNVVSNVVIENCKTGLSSTNDNNLTIDGLTVQSATSVGMTFTTSNNLTVRNVSVFNAGTNGIDLTNPLNATLANITLYNTGTQGLLTFGTTQNCNFENMEITLANMIYGINIATANNCVLTNCVVSGLGSTTYSNTVTGIFLGPVAQAGNDNILDSCSVENLNSTGNITGIGIQAATTQIKNCKVQFFNSGNSVIGFVHESTSNTYHNCIANAINSTGGANTGSSIGFSLAGGATNVFNCIADSMSILNTTGNEAVGFLINAADISCYDSIATNITTPLNTTGFGFQIASTATDTFLNGCIASYGNADGFRINDLTTILYRCQSINNTLNGIDVSSGTGVVLVECNAIGNTLNGINLTAGNTHAVYHCFAANNGTNFVNVPNAQLASGTLLAGVNVRFS